MDTSPDDIMRAIQSKGAEFTIGMDIPRTWATAAQVFIAPEISTLVFREQALLASDGKEPELLTRNVASIILPTEILREVHQILGREIEKLDVPEAE